jgi:hypothetical protein
MYTGRMTKLPQAKITPVALMPVITATPAIQVVTTETPAPTPTVDISTLTEPQSEKGGMGTVLGISLVTSTLVIGLAIGFVFIRARKSG